MVIIKSQKGIKMSEIKVSKENVKEFKRQMNSIFYGKKKVDSLPSDVKEVIINDTTVIVELIGGAKGVAKCGHMDLFDPYVGFCIAYYKAKNGKNFELKTRLESCIESANKKGYKTAILKNHDKSSISMQIAPWTDFTCNVLKSRC
jgi:hypothetical protein